MMGNQSGMMGNQCAMNNMQQGYPQTQFPRSLDSPLESGYYSGTGLESNCNVMYVQREEYFIQL